MGATFCGNHCANKKADKQHDTSLGGRRQTWTTLCTTKSRRKIELVVSQGELCTFMCDKIFFVVAHYVLSGFLSCILLPFWPRPGGWPGLPFHRADGAVHQSNNRFILRSLGEHRRDALAARWFGSGSLINGERILQTKMCKFVSLFVVEASPKGGGAAINA